MKKLLLLSIFVASLFVTKAQITITSDNAPQLGDALEMMKIFEPENVLPGDAGENIIWDFSGNVEDNPGAQIFNYIDPTGKPQVSIMNSPDVAEQINSDETGYFYFGVDDGDWMRHGVYAYDGTTELYWSYTTPLKMYDYPFTYEDNLAINDFTATGMMGDYELELNSTYYGYDCDAYGILILPHRTFVNAVRVHITEQFTMATDIGLGGFTDVAIITDDSYFWFAEGVKGPVMSITTSQTEDLIGGSGTSESISARWYHETNPAEITVDFAANQLTGDTYTDFYFYNGANPRDGSTYQWEFTPNTVEFVAGTSATDINPEVRFLEAGTYTASLTVTNDNFPDAITETKTDYIEVIQAPELVIDFSASNVMPATDEIITLTSDVSVSTGDDLIGTTTYEWNLLPSTGWEFANFTTGEDANPDVMFTAAGCYHVQLTVSNNEYPNSPVTITKMNYISADGGCGDAYTVTFNVTDGTNAIDEAEITVSGYPSITTDASGVATIDLFNGDYDFTVTATGFTNYTDGTFTVSDLDLDVNVEMTTASSINNNNSSIIIYPNPTSGIFRIDGANNSEIIITDITGKVIYNEAKEKATIIDLSNQSKGIYMIKINSINKVETYKIILQ